MSEVLAHFRGFLSLYILVAQSVRLLMPDEKRVETSGNFFKEPSNRVVKKVR
jgi:hypothetical protein